jgi:hypothetical protein
MGGIERKKEAAPGQPSQPLPRRRHPRPRRRHPRPRRRPHPHRRPHRRPHPRRCPRRRVRCVADPSSRLSRPRLRVRVFPVVASVVVSSSSVSPSSCSRRIRLRRPIASVFVAPSFRFLVVPLPRRFVIRPPGIV